MKWMLCASPVLAWKKKLKREQKKTIAHIVNPLVFTQTNQHFSCSVVHFDVPLYTTALASRRPQHTWVLAAITIVSSGRKWLKTAAVRGSRGDSPSALSSPERLTAAFKGIWTPHVSSCNSVQCCFADPRCFDLRFIDNSLGIMTYHLLVFWR